MRPNSSKLGSLYPDWLLDSEVGALTVPGVSNPAATGTPNSGDVESYYGPNIRGRSSSGFLVYVRKAYPHSPFDCLAVTDPSPSVTSSLADLTPRQWEEVASLIEAFYEFVQQEEIQENYHLTGGVPHVSFNFAGRRQDREDSMYYDRRLHVHLNFFDASTLAQVERSRLRDLDPISRVRLVDPASWIAEEMTVGFAQLDVPLTYVHAEPVRDRTISRSEVGLRFRCTAENFPTKEVAMELAQLHRRLVDAYGTLSDCFLTAPRYEPWCRGSLRPRAEIISRLADQPMLAGGEAFEALSELAGILRNHPDHTTISPEMVPLRLILPDLDYSVVVRPDLNANEYVILLQPRIFSDSGAAGCPSVNGSTAVRITRSSAMTMTKDFEVRRERFRQDFLRAAGV